MRGLSFSSQRKEIDDVPGFLLLSLCALKTWGSSLPPILQIFQAAGSYTLDRAQMVQLFAVPAVAACVTRDDIAAALHVIGINMNVAAAAGARV
jgi:hypothetical protein